MAYCLSSVHKVAGIILFFFATSFCASDSLTTTPGTMQDSSRNVQSSSQTQKKISSSSVDTTIKGKEQPVTSQAKIPEKIQKPKVAEEELMEEDLLLPEKGEVLPVRKTAEVKKDDSTKSSMSHKTIQDTNTTSAKTAVSNDTVASPVNPSPVATLSVAKKPETPIKIEDGKAINFAKNLKEYRSPKLAMLLSLLVPGLGQIYIGNKINYVKAGAFLVAEAGLIGIGALYINKADNKAAQSKKFADTAYSYNKMNNYYDSLLLIFNNKTQKDSMSQAFRNNIYSDSLSGFKASYNNGAPTKDYYSTINYNITGNYYIQGWKDCEPSPGEILGGTQNSNNQYTWKQASDSMEFAYLLTGLIIKGTDTIVEIKSAMGFSQYQKDYAAMLTQSRNYYAIGTNLFYCIVLNHVISAADALLGAKAYNDELLGKQSFWHNFSVEPTTVLAGISPRPGLLMRIRF